jgi:hypothetical protein
MAKVGRFVTDPRAGSYGYVTVDTREAPGEPRDVGPEGPAHRCPRQALGLNSEPLFAASLDLPDGQDILAT